MLAHDTAGAIGAPDPTIGTSPSPAAGVEVTRRACARIRSPSRGRSVIDGRSSRVWPGSTTQAIAPRDRRQDEHGLHHGEVVADADPRAVAEREVRATGEPLDQVVVPTLGPEDLGVFEPAAVAVHEPLRQEELRPLRDVIAADLAVGQGLACDPPGRRIQPHRLAHDPLGVLQAGHVGGRRRPVAEHRLQLVGQAILGLRASDRAGRRCRTAPARWSRDRRGPGSRPRRGAGDRSSPCPRRRARPAGARPGRPRPGRPRGGPG